MAQERKRNDTSWAPLPPATSSEAPWVTKWRRETELYTEPWRPPPHNYNENQFTAAVKERQRKARGIAATPAPTHEPWDKKDHVRRWLHWASDVT